MMVYTSMLEKKGKETILKLLDKPQATQEPPTYKPKSKKELEAIWQKVDQNKENGRESKN